jgi:hypothetical protein
LVTSIKHSFDSEYRRISTQISKAVSRVYPDSKDPISRQAFVIIFSFFTDEPPCGEQPPMISTNKKKSVMKTAIFLDFR